MTEQSWMGRFGCLGIKFSKSKHQTGMDDLANELHMQTQVP